MIVKRIDHIAVAVENLDQSCGFWEQVLGLHVHEVRNVPEQAVDVAFLPVGESEIELVKPVTEDSGIAKWMAKRGPGIHHICLEVDDIRQALADMAAKGVQLIDAEPRLGAGGKLYAFVHPKSTGGVLVELYQAPE
ncbi:MAG: methylmalonyl-CoA epimerase [Thermoflexales bacterium]|nr:methylmalonyl-CoA epimerase [Thermoflexales bacterium]